MPEPCTSDRLTLRLSDPGTRQMLVQMAKDPRLQWPLQFGAEAQRFERRETHIAAFLRKGGQLVGSVQLLEDHLVYFIAPEHWELGFASEMLPAALSYAAERCDHRPTRAAVLRENEASRRLLVKNGFVFHGLSQRRALTGHALLTLLEYCR